MWFEATTRGDGHRSSGQLGWRAALCALLGFSGCQTYQPRPVDPAGALAAVSNRTLEDPAVQSALTAAGLGNGRDAEGRWRLEALPVIATGLSPSIARARKEQEAALASIDVAQAPGDLGLNFDLERAVQTTMPWIYGFTVDWTWQTGHKRQIKGDKARAEANRAALALAGVEWDTRSAALRAAWELSAAVERAQAQDLLAAAIREWQEADRTLLEVGEISRLELMTANRESAQVDLDLSDTRKRIASARTRLARSLGVPTRDPADWNLEPWPGELPAPPDQAGLLQQVALARPDVLEQLAAYAATEENLRLEIAKQYPDVRLGPGYTYDQGQNKWLLGWGLTFPLDGNRAGIASAQADREVAAARFTEVQANAIAEVIGARTAYVGELEKLQTAGALVRESEAQLQTQQSALELGSGDRLAVILARVELQRARLARLDSRESAWAACLDLMDAARKFLPPFDAP